MAVGARANPSSSPPLACGRGSESDPHVTAPACKLGIASTSYMMVWRPQDSLEFLEHCHALGAAGIQCPIEGDPLKLRHRAEQFGMYVEAWVPLPQGSDTGGFEESLKTALAAGATALRSACLGTRRYETFRTLDQWRAFVQSSNESLAAALPILDRYKIPLGLENHKDWTADEMHELLERHSNEHLGVCLDFGNNISLLDEPMYVVEKLAPYTVSTHLKNMGVESFPDGFLLSEVLPDEGFLDLQRMISLVRQARPKTRFSLEMITRDPLKVPCLTGDYWTSFPERNGIYLARTLKLVESKHSSQPLPRVAQLSQADQLRIENENVIACLNYAREKLDL